MVERFFAEITRKRIRRGVFKSVDELKRAIMDYLDKHNDQPKPYVWTKTAAEIFTKVAHAKQALESQGVLTQDESELPSETVRILNAGIHSLVARGWTDVRGVTGDGHVAHAISVSKSRRDAEQ